MTVHVGEVSSEVVAEGAAPASSAGAAQQPASRWQELERLAALQRQLQADAARIEARAYGD
jgi:hypothetical protein